MDVSRLGNPRRDWALVGAAGPLSNLVMAVGLALLLAILSGIGLAAPGVPLAEVLAIGIFVNVLLAVFNLMPIPPSRRLAGAPVLPLRGCARCLSPSRALRSARDRGTRVLLPARAGVPQRGDRGLHGGDHVAPRDLGRHGADPAPGALRVRSGALRARGRSLLTDTARLHASLLEANLGRAAGAPGQEARRDLPDVRYRERLRSCAATGWGLRRGARPRARDLSERLLRHLAPAQAHEARASRR